MATVAEFADALAKVDAETTRIGDLIQQLTSQLGKGLTEAEEANVLAQLNAAGDRLKQVGNSVTDPVPNPTPDPNDPGNTPV